MSIDVISRHEAEAEAYEDELRREQGPMCDGIYEWGRAFVAVYKRAPKNWLVYESDQPLAERVELPQLRRIGAPVFVHETAAYLVRALLEVPRDTTGYTAICYALDTLIGEYKP